ncbi:MAG TPA: L,D-transpeptidase [Rhodobacteraceae bacterium]|nr:L,D-transpeptidase [Paracoccaceae bacterium]
MSLKKFERRQFLASTAAFGAVAASGLGAQAAANNGLPEAFQPVEVRLKADLPAGEIHVIPDTFKLYWTLEKRYAIRYTVGIGRPGLYHPGEFTVGRKAKWPSWTPTPAMIKRNPAYEQWKDGMPGGPNNPLGARALYLYDAAGRDTYLRIHGTNLPRTIGVAVSNGCARLINEQVIELYDKVPVGTRVVLYDKGERPKMR